ncbi:glycosyltransferase [Candidatus Nitrososphaera evergladensis SR1]|uniref:Glycosyltransferase n=1 Tax=Candidatus Nitrososphaera evergladensis SR1 TaxID=1459636 RepID=A0A075MSS4_9ARCH|nr:glycosyltransferase [Candidatus Nitrososphaera evergladensis]AIF84200.1 glycosyltransferase [Candidatus Nitrososphaera evergladensis SR1]
MRILHLSHDGLPDWRVEKSALTSSKQGYEVFFAGKKIADGYDATKVFSQAYEINWTAKALCGMPYYWHSVRNQLAKVIKQVRPDMVHAHNLFSAKLVQDLGERFVYDDHESWSKHSLLLSEMEEAVQQQEAQQYVSNASSGGSLVHSIMSMAARTKRSAVNRRTTGLWAKWEKEVLDSSAATITVSNRIAKELRLASGSGSSSRIVVVPNYPTKQETSDLEKPRYLDRLSSVYSGSDGQSNGSRRLPNRNMDGLYDLFNNDSSSSNKNTGTLTILGWQGTTTDPSSRVEFAGFLSRKEMFKEMSNHSIGLLPWKRHWSHYFVNPNKVYEYAHAGLHVMCTSSFDTVIETFQGNCTTFDDYKDLASQLEYYDENMEELYKKRVKTYEFAHSNLVWENFEPEILRAYQLS